LPLPRFYGQRVKGTLTWVSCKHRRCTYLCTRTHSPLPLTFHSPPLYVPLLRYHSRLLSTSLSLGTTCSTGACCVRGIVESSHPHASALRLSLSQHRHLFTFSPIGLAFCAVINNNEETILHDVAAQNGKLAVHHAGPYSVERR
jgi:hypothetical protein